MKRKPPAEQKMGALAQALADMRLYTGKDDDDDDDDDDDAEIDDDAWDIDDD